jgi:hypothetical protein
MIKPLTVEQRTKVAEKIMEWGNLVFVGLAISQVFPQVSLSLARFVVGCLIIAGAYWFAIRLLQGGEQ